MFQSDDDFFVNAHKKYEDIDATNIHSVVDRRRMFFIEDMVKKRDREVDCKYFDATGWGETPLQGYLV